MEKGIPQCQPLSLEFDPGFCIMNAECQKDITNAIGHEDLTQSLLQLNNTSRDSLSLGSALCECHQVWCEGILLMRHLSQACGRKCWKYLRDPFFEGTPECFPGQTEYDMNICKTVQCEEMIHQIHSSTQGRGFQDMVYAIKPELLNNGTKIWADLKLCSHAMMEYHENLLVFSQYLLVLFVPMVFCVILYAWDPAFMRHLRARCLSMRGRVRDLAMDQTLLETRVNQPDSEERINIISAT